MGKPSTIDAYFKRKANEAPQASNSSTLPSTTQLLDTTELSEQQFKVPRIEEVDISLLEKDPGKRCFIWQYHIDQRDKIRRAYIKDGPYQPTNIIFPASGIGNRRRHFQPSWFKKFPSWLAYSPHKDAAFCLPCYLFNNNHGDPNDGRNAFAGVGFRNWKKVNDGKNCAFLFHEGVGPNSLHKRCLKFCDDLMDQSQHIEKVFDRQRFEIIANNRLRLKASIDAVRWLTFQACAFRGNDESLHSLNRGNFIELIKLLASYNSNVANVVLANALEMLNLSHLLFRKKYCIFLLEGYMLQYVKRLVILNFVLLLMKLGMNQKGKKMAIVLRFVDKDGYVQERFFDLIHVANTSSLTMKKEISGVLSRHCLDIQNLHGQGYDGPSNMPGEWNGFQALLLKDCHYAYYIHCLAHRLQLALVAAAREVCHVHQFFSNLALIVNVVTASPKRHDQLQAAQMTIITNLIASDDIETDSGFNQIGTLQRATDTRWGSQLNSVRSLLCMFDATCEVLQKATKEGNCSVRGDANSAYDILTSFEFIFLLHLMRDILAITHELCHALQCKNQDILNAMPLVSTTKSLILRMRESGWEIFFKTIISFCEKHEINVPDMTTLYIPRRGRARQNVDDITVEHYYRINLFIATLDTQLEELNSRFCDNMVELLTLSSALDPKDTYKSLNVEKICELATKFYPNDFTDQEKLHLRVQAQHYEVDVPFHSELRNLSIISELCQGLMKTGKYLTYHLIDRLIRLILTLSVSTATTERSFSAMKIVKNRIRNKIEDGFLADCLITYIERMIAEKFDTDSIIDEFYDMKERRA